MKTLTTPDNHKYRVNLRDIFKHHNCHVLKQSESFNDYVPLCNFTVKRVWTWSLSVDLCVDLDNQPFTNQHITGQDLFAFKTLNGTEEVILTEKQFADLMLLKYIYYHHCKNYVKQYEKDYSSDDPVINKLLSTSKLY